MLACSRLALVLLSVAVPCALAQHAPPVSDSLLTEARRVVCRGVGEGAQVRVWRAERWRREHLPRAASLLGSVVSCAGVGANPTLG